MNRFLSVLILFAISINTQAALQFYTDRASFDADYSSLTFEDFNDLSHPFITPTNTLIGLAEPLNPASFSTGTIEPGIEIATIFGSGLIWAEPTWDAGLGPVNSTNFFGTNQNLVGNGLKLSFTNSNVIGFDIFSIGDLGAGNPVFAVTVFDTVGDILGSSNVIAPLAGQFFGVASTDQIGRIEVLSPISRVELFDNVAFGNETVVPIPAAIWLFASGLLGLFTLKKTPPLKQSDS